MSTAMSEVYKLIHPVKFFNDYLSKDLRPDGRSFNEHRNIKLSTNAIQSADASALIKCGSTSVVCGISLQLSPPKAEEPDKGFLITNVELPPLCSARFRPGPPSDTAQVISKIVADIVTNSKCVDLNNLCIIPHKWVWCVKCDLVCLDYGGSIVDACITALMASLKSLLLPKMIYDSETEVLDIDLGVKSKLNIQGLPVATSFAIYKYNQRDVILVDPSSYEEDMCGGIGANLMLCYTKGSLCSSQKFGGGNLTEDFKDQALKLAKKRAEIVEKLIDVSIKHSKDKTNNNTN